MILLRHGTRVVLIAIALAAGLLQAHPMGNFSVSHYARIEVTPRGIQIRYVLDLAEIPTLELFQSWNLQSSTPHQQLERRAPAQARQWVDNLVMRSNGRAVTPVVESTQLVLADGAGNMPVARISCQLRVPATPGRLEYEDRNYSERAGWKEIVISGVEGASIVQTTQGDRDRSQALTSYPQDPTLAPPQDLHASAEWTVAPVTTSRSPERPNKRSTGTATRPPAAVAERPLAPTEAGSSQNAGTPAIAQPSTAGVVARGDYLSRLLNHREIGIGMALLGIAVAFGLGAMHALSPGHGKTIVAAYLVGSHGTPKHALFLGGMVTFTHTISVFFLGFTTLFLSRYVLPEKLYPVLGTISGLSIVWIGAMLLYRRASLLHSMRSGGQHVPHDHDHLHHDHDHSHDGLTHTHDGHTHSHVPQGEVSVGSLIALGASGGLVPCPSALVLLLSSIALGRIGLGLLLLVGFSAGLAMVLMTIGLVVVYAKHLLPDRAQAAAHPAFRLLPVVSAAVIVCIGLIMTGVSLGWIRPDRVLGLM